MSPISNWCSNWYWKSLSVYMKMFCSPNANVSENSWPGMKWSGWREGGGNENKTIRFYLGSKLYGKSNWVIIMCAKLNLCIFLFRCNARTILRIWSRVCARLGNDASETIYVIEAWKNATMRTCTFDPRVFIHNFAVPISVGLEIVCHRVVGEARLKVVCHIRRIWALV